MGNTRKTISHHGTTAAIRVYMDSPAGQKKMSTTARRPVESSVASRVRNTIDSRFRHTLQAIGTVLQNPGVGSIGTGATTVKFTQADNSAGAIRVNWKPLSPRYAARKRVSKTFWRKGDRSKGSYTQLAELYSAAMAGTGKVSRYNTSSSVSKTRPDRIEIRMRVRLPRLPTPLNALITSPFLRGRVNPDPLVSGFSRGQNSLTRILFPEAQRPLVSLLAARMGKDMYRDLRNIK